MKINETKGVYLCNLSLNSSMLNRSNGFGLNLLFLGLTKGVFGMKENFSIFPCFVGLNVLENVFQIN